MAEYAVSYGKKGFLMKIMVIADEESKYLWDFFERSMLDGIDLIISCGDLDPRLPFFFW